MPNFLQITLWTAAGITAVGIIFRIIFLKGILPAIRFMNEVERSVPILRDITDKLSDPDLISVIVEIANQFKTDSGSSLRDLVNRLELASNSAAVAIDLLRVSAEGSRQLAETDRAQIARLLIMLDRIQVQAAGVASDLKDSHERAASSGPIPGQAADAAVLSDTKGENE